MRWPIQDFSDGITCLLFGQFSMEKLHEYDKKKHGPCTFDEEAFFSSSV